MRLPERQGERDNWRPGAPVCPLVPDFTDLRRKRDCLAFCLWNRVCKRESRGGGTGPRQDPLKLLAQGHHPAQSQWAGRGVGVQAPLSQAAGCKPSLETRKALESSLRLHQSCGSVERQLPNSRGREGRGEWRPGLG